MVLVWAAASTLIVAGVVMSATQRLKAVDDMAKAEFSAQGQASQVAEAGIVDAYAWFRRQTVQPVTVYAPARNLTASPPINDTDDATKGLVRTYEVSPGLWARYTVSKGKAPETYTDTVFNGHYDTGEVFVDTNADRRWTPGQGTRDVTVERGLPGTGTVWQIVSYAQMFRRPRADLSLGEGPNVQIAEARLAAELRRLTLVPPATAALCSKTSGNVNIGTRARITSDSTCIAYGANSGTAVVQSGALTGPTGLTLVPGWKDDVDSVFGVDFSTLKSMADISTTDPVNGVPGRLPDMTLVVVTGDIVFDSDRPLKGTAVLVVKGNCTINASSNSFFSGLLYVTGTLTIRAPALIRGTVICTGPIDIRGTGGDYVEVEREPKILTKLMTVMGQYRLSKAPFRPSHAMADGRPDELYDISRVNRP